MEHSILLVDNDQAFSSILKEGLEATGDFRVTLTNNGSDALESVVERSFDLVVVDMGLRDVRPVTLVKAIREAKPSMRLMLIPLFGGQIPDELKEVKIQGILPKPFFVGDLPAIVGRAMGIETPVPVPELEAVAPAAREAAAPAKDKPLPSPPPVEESLQAGEVTTPPEPEPPKAPPSEAPAFSPETLARLQAKERQIVQLLKSLNREVRTESLMVTLGAQLVAFAGLLNREQTAKLAGLVAGSTEAAARAAAFLGEPTGRFEQSLHEGSEYRLYSLSLGDGLVLSLALSSDTPLGALRYHTRQTAEELLELLA